MTEHNRLPKPLSNEVLADNVRVGGEVGADALLELVERATSGNCTFTLAAVKGMGWLPPGLAATLTADRDAADVAFEREKEHHRDTANALRRSEALVSSLTRQLDEWKMGARAEADHADELQAQVAVLTRERDEALAELDTQRYAIAEYAGFGQVAQKALSAANAQVAVYRQALEHIASLPDISGSARRRADSLAREALAAVVVGQPEEVSEPGRKVPSKPLEAAAHEPGSLTSPVVGQPGETPAGTGDAQSAPSGGDSE